MRRVVLPLLVMVMVLLGACTAPAPMGEPSAAANVAADPAPAPQAAPAPAAQPPVQAPSPLAERAPAFDPMNPDRRCRTDADCAVKDVGNCCGTMPACVSANARVDPAAVKAQCARDGLSSTCGFVEVRGCSCVEGLCQASDGAVTQ